MSEPAKKNVLELWSRKADAFAALGEALAGLGFDVRILARETDLEDYLDSDDALLHRSGAALCLRTAGSVTTLRLEPLSPASTAPAEAETLEGPPAEFPSSIPGRRISRRLSALLGDAAVNVRLRLERESVTSRATMPGGVEVDVRCRVVRVINLGVCEPFAEVALEAPDGSAAALDVLASPLVRQFGLVPVDRHELERALEVAGQTPAGLVEGPELTLQPEDRFVDAAYRVMRRQFERMLWNEPGTRLGLDPDRLHDMRVAARRLRAAVSCFGGGLPAGRAKSLQETLEWVGRALGRVRDLDVHLLRLDEDARDLSGEMHDALDVYRKFLLDRREKARDDMLRLLSTRRYASFVDGLRRFLDAGAPRKPSVPGAKSPVTKASGSIIRKRLKKVLRDGRALGPDSSDAELHRLRILCKRLRYACEFFADLYGPDAVKFAERVSDLQGILGDQHDAVVAGETLGEFSQEIRVPARLRRQVFMALGHLMAQHARRAKTARTDFAKLWERFDRKRVRRPLLSRLEPASVRAAPPDAPGEPE